MPFIDTPQGRFEGTQAQIDAYKAASNPSRSPIGPTTKDDSPDTMTGADFMTRLGASFQVSPAGKINFYKSKYGDGNVATDDRGEIMYRPRKGARWILADEQQWTLKDIADFAGDVPGMVLGTMGGTAGATAGLAAGPLAVGASPAAGIAGAAMGAAAGNAAKQGLGAAFFPADQGMTPLARVGDMATDAAIGGAAQGATVGMTALRDLVRPQNILAKTAGAAVARPDTQAVLRASADTGIPLTTSEATGSKTLRALEDASRRVPIVADKYRVFDQGQADAAVSRIKGIMNDLHADEMGSESYGIAAKRAFDKVRDDAVAVRRNQAKIDFDAVADLGKDVLLPVRRTKQALLDVIEQNDVAGGGDATANMVNQLKRVSDQIGTAISPQEFKRLLQIYGKGAAGKGKPFADMDTADQRRISGEVHRALNRDLDAAVAAGEKVNISPQGEASRAAASGGAMSPSQLRALTEMKNPRAAMAALERGDVAAALKTARDNYALNSAKITELGDSVLGDYFETAASRTPERVADKVRLMKPTEIRATLGLLREADPEIAEKTASHFLQTALNKATDVSTPFSAAKFLKNLPPEAAQEALLGGKPALGEIRKVAQVLERVREKPAEGSQTAGRLLTMLTTGAGFGLALAAPITTATTAATTMLTANTIAKAMLTARGRDALTQVATRGPKTKGAISAANYLTGLAVMDQRETVDQAIADAKAAPSGAR